MIRIKEFRKRAGLSQQDVAAALGVSRSAVAMWETGKSQPDSATLARLAALLQVSADDLLGIPPLRGLDVRPIESFSYIPVVATVAAGRGGEVDADITAQQLAVNVLSPEECRYFRVQGDSMSPQIMEGDLALVRLCPSVQSGQLAVVLVDEEEGLIKQVKLGDNSLTLVSFNPADPPRVFVGEDIRRVRIWKEGSAILFFRPTFWQVASIRCPMSELPEAEALTRKKLKRMKRVKMQPVVKSEKKKKR